MDYLLSAVEYEMDNNNHNNKRAKKIEYNDIGIDIMGIIISTALYDSIQPASTYLNFLLVSKYWSVVTRTIVIKSARSLRGNLEEVTKRVIKYLLCTVGIEDVRYSVPDRHKVDTSASDYIYVWNLYRSFLEGQLVNNDTRGCVAVRLSSDSIPKFPGVYKFKVTQDGTITYMVPIDQLFLVFPLNIKNTRMRVTGECVGWLRTFFTKYSNWKDKIHYEYAIKALSKNLENCRRLIVCTWNIKI